MALQWADLGGAVVDFAAVFREAVEVGDDIVAFGQLARGAFADGVQIKVIKAVTLGLPDELVRVVGQEIGGALRLHELLVAIFEDGLDEVAGEGIVFVKLEVVLLAVEYADIDALVVGVPGDGGEVLLGRLASLYNDFLACGDGIDMQGDLMACHTCHRVFDGLGGGDALLNVDQWIVRHHALVHRIVGEELAVGRPEDAAVDGELVAMYALASHHAFRVVGDLDLLVALGHVEVVVNRVGHVQGGFTNCLVFSTLRY